MGEMMKNPEECEKMLEMERGFLTWCDVIFHVIYLL